MAEEADDERALAGEVAEADVAALGVEREEVGHLSPAPQTGGTPCLRSNAGSQRER